LRSPQDVAVDPAGSIYVADGENHRVLRFPPVLLLPLTNSDAAQVIGQPGMGGAQANWNGSEGLASGDSFFAPAGLLADRNGTLYVADFGNSRVVHFLRTVTATNAVHFQAGAAVSPGSLVTLWGDSFTHETAEAAALPLPHSLGGIGVEVLDQIEAPLLFVSSQQINFQLPVAVPVGSQRIAVRRSDTAELLAGGFVEVAAAGPALFSLQAGGSGQALAMNQNGTLNSEANPAPKGSVVTLYGSGQGEVSPAVPDGEGAPSAPAHTTATPTSDSAICLTQAQSVCVAVGSSFGEVMFSGLAPGFVGLWQLNVKIPEKDTLLTGPAVPVRAVIQGRATNVVQLAIQ
jgi:uncharacterized protein (TIGR03437 family)